LAFVPLPHSFPLPALHGSGLDDLILLGIALTVGFAVIAISNRAERKRKEKERWP
jgi:hypothetical protein